MSIGAGFAIESDGYLFTLTKVGIEVYRADKLLAIIPTLTNSGINYVRTIKDLEEEAAWWIAR